MYKIKLFFNAFRLLPHIFFYLCNRGKIFDDVVFWHKCLNKKEIPDYKKNFGVCLLFYLLTTYKEFRSIFYYRYKRSRFLKIIAPGQLSLHIGTKKIGKGLFIEHGFSTIISAKSIGDFCWINQQVTLGYANGGNPIIGNNVRIGAGAIVIGDISIGDNSTVGAGCTVVKSVPNNSLVVSAPARIIENHYVNDSLTIE